MKETEQTPEENTAHSFTESAYTTVSSNTHTCGKFEIKSHFDVRLGDPVIVTDETGTYKSWIGGVNDHPESAYKEGERKKCQFNCVPGYCLSSNAKFKESDCTYNNPDKPVSAPSESQPDIFYGYLEEGVYGEFRHVPEPSPNKDKIGFIFGGKRYEFSRLSETKNKAMENNKPDFLKLEEEKFGSMADNATWSDGCEHVWNTHVVPLQEKANLFDACKAEALRYSDMIVKLQDREEILNGAYGNALQRIQEIESKLKESEHLKELAEDAIVTLQKENERLKNDLNKWVTMRHGDAIKSLREEIERLKAEAVRNALK